jgi:hypothetical protein
MPAVVAVTVAAVAIGPGPGVLCAQEQPLTLRAGVVGAAIDASLTIELFRWSTDDERSPLLEALTAPPPSPDPPAEGRAGGSEPGRGRGRGRGGPPPTPVERLAAAIKAAPTVGFIWGEGPTGYSIKYAWRALSPDGSKRVVLVTDRRLGAHSTAFPALSGGMAGSGFTVIEMRIDDEGNGEGKASLTTDVVVDAAASTLALDGYGAAPVLLKVTR